MPYVPREPIASTWRATRGIDQHQEFAQRRRQVDIAERRNTECRGDKSGFDGRTFAAVRSTDELDALATSPANELLDEIRRTVVAAVVDEHETPERLGYHKVCERGSTRRESVRLVVQRHDERECAGRFAMQRQRLFSIVRAVAAQPHEPPFSCSLAVLRAPCQLPLELGFSRRSGGSGEGRLETRRHVASAGGWLRRLRTRRRIERTLQLVEPGAAPAVMIHEHESRGRVRIGPSLLAGGRRVHDHVSRRCDEHVVEPFAIHRLPPSGAISDPCRFEIARSVLEDLHVVRDVVSSEWVLQDRTDETDALVVDGARPPEGVGEVRRIAIAVIHVEILEREEPCDEEHDRCAGDPRCPRSIDDIGTATRPGDDKAQHDQHGEDAAHDSERGLTWTQWRETELKRRAALEAPQLPVELRREKQGSENDRHRARDTRSRTAPMQPRVQSRPEPLGLRRSER